MNRFNNKKYYKPPPVKPSNRLREKPKEDWNPYQSDLNKYKLSNAEILKKKINATSKNLEEAKRDWQGQIAMIQNGKMKINFDDDIEGRQKIVRKKIDLTPMNRFEKRSVNIDTIRNNDRNIYQNNRINRPYSGYEDNYRNKTKKIIALIKRLEIIFNQILLKIIIFMMTRMMMVKLKWYIILEIM